MSKTDEAIKRIKDMPIKDKKTIGYDYMIDFDTVSVRVDVRFN